jgi:hypothetical protein
MIAMRSTLLRQFKSAERIFSHRIGIVVGLGNSATGLCEWKKGIRTRHISNSVVPYDQDNRVDATHLLEKVITIGIKTVNTTNALEQSML